VIVHPVGWSASDWISVGRNRSGTGAVIAFDVLGGQFAWVPANPGQPPTVHDFGPDDLAWQNLEQGYADWLLRYWAGR
jgi:hypothetical protein